MAVLPTEGTAMTRGIRDEERDEEDEEHVILACV